MKIKSCVWYWLAAASGTASLLYGMGIEGGAQLGSSISDSQFVTALCLVLAAVAFLRLGFSAQDREQNARRYGRIDRTHARTEEPDYRQNHRLPAGQQCNLLLLCQKVHLRVNAGLVTAYRKLCTRKRRRGCRGHQQKRARPCW